MQDIQNSQGPGVPPPVLYRTHEELVEEVNTPKKAKCAGKTVEFKDLLKPGRFHPKNLILFARQKFKTLGVYAEIEFKKLQEFRISTFQDIKIMVNHMFLRKACTWGVIGGAIGLGVGLLTGFGAIAVVPAAVWIGFGTGVGTGLLSGIHSGRKAIRKRHMKQQEAIQQANLKQAQVVLQDAFDKQAEENAILKDKLRGCSPENIPTAPPPPYIENEPPVDKKGGITI